jgi:hypothetical protein
MTALTLVSGRLQGEPVTRPTKTGGRVTFFKLRVAVGSEVQFWNIATFSDAVREEVEGLAKGSALSASGELHVEPYEWKGEIRLNFRLTADRILALKAPLMEIRRRRETRQPRRSRRAARADIPLSVKVGGEP